MQVGFAFIAAYRFALDVPSLRRFIAIYQRLFISPAPGSERRLGSTRSSSGGRLSRRHADTPNSAPVRGCEGLGQNYAQEQSGFSGFGRPNPEQQPSTPAHSALGTLSSRVMEDGPKHSPPLPERAGGAGAAFPESWRRFNLGPNCETASGGGRSVVLEPCTKEFPHAMNRYINVMYYLCNLILIYTIVGDCSVIQNKYISSLAPSVFNLGVPLSPRSPHKSWHCGTALPICVGCNNS